MTSRSPVHAAKPYQVIRRRHDDAVNARDEVVVRLQLQSQHQTNQVSAQHPSFQSHASQNSTSRSATKRVRKRRPVQKYLKLLRLSSMRPMPFCTDDPVYENWVRSTGSASSSLVIVATRISTSSSNTVSSPTQKLPVPLVSNAAVLRLANEVQHQEQDAKAPAGRLDRKVVRCSRKNTQSRTAMSINQKSTPPLPIAIVDARFWNGMNCLASVAKSRGGSACTGVGAARSCV